MSRLRDARVAVFGLGGVGGWCVEALARTGVGHFLLVDGDRVAPSNVNRQIVASVATIGEPKADVMRRRVLEVNPSAEAESRVEFYNEATAGSYRLEDWDFVIDAIDSVDCKARLIRHALSVPSVTLFSSMGAARRLDPSRIRRAEFRKVAGDGLARALRGRFRKSGEFPQRKFMCVYSDEAPACEELGSVVQVTASFGLTLAAMVVDQIRGNGK